MACEAWCWNLQDLLAGYISKAAMATQAAIPPLEGLLWCSGYSLGCGAGTVIGNLLGENRPRDAQRSAVLSMMILQIAIVPQSLGLYLARGNVAPLFTSDPGMLSQMESLAPL